MNGNLVLAVWQMLRQILYPMEANFEIFSNPVLWAVLFGLFLKLVFDWFGVQLPKGYIFAHGSVQKKAAAIVIQPSLIQKSET